MLTPSELVKYSLRHRDLVPVAIGADQLSEERDRTEAQGMPVSHPVAEAAAEAQ
jgi:hypothetical protein